MRLSLAFVAICVEISIFARAEEGQFVDMSRRSGSGKAVFRAPEDRTSVCHSHFELPAVPLQKQYEWSAVF